MRRRGVDRPGSIVPAAVPHRPLQNGMDLARIGSWLRAVAIGAMAIPAVIAAGLRYALRLRLTE